MVFFNLFKLNFFFFLTQDGAENQRYECLVFTQILCLPGIFIKPFALYIYSILIKQKESEIPKFHFLNESEESQELLMVKNLVV